MSLSLREYQVDGVNSIRQSYLDGYKAPLYVLPTGGGKTVMYAYIAQQSSEKGKRVLILEHRKELIIQASNKLTFAGVPHGIIAPGFSMTGDLVQVASVQTLVNRIGKIPIPDVIIIDEAHHSTAGSWAKIIDTYNTAKLLGVTATPVRMDGKGLGKNGGGFYDTLICGPSVSDLISQSYLVQPVVYAPPSGFSTAGIKKVAGDFDKKEVSERIDKPVITGCAIEHYNKICPDAPALVFCASLKHAAHVQEQAKDAGLTAEIIDGTQSDSIRKSRIEGLASGSIKWLLTVDVVSEGTDIPIVGAAILLRPTYSLGLYLQQVGRALRPYAGKERAVILDHVGNCLRHGLPDDTREWTLDGAKKKKKAEKETTTSIKMCKKCYAVFPPHLDKCPICGDVVELNGREYRQVDGELVEIKKEEVKAKMAPEEHSKLRKMFAIGKKIGLSDKTIISSFHSLKKKGMYNV